MNTACRDFVKYIVEDAPRYNKSSVEDAALKKYNFIKVKYFLPSYFIFSFDLS